MGETGGSYRGGALTRRQFLKSAMAGGSMVALPVPLLGKQLVSKLGLQANLANSDPTSPAPPPFFLSTNYTSPDGDGPHDLYATAQAICARIIPTDSLPTGEILVPGATEAAAVDYIDLFMAAFQPAYSALPPGIASRIGQYDLPLSLVSNPPIWLGSRYSGYDGTGIYSGRYAPGDPSSGEPAAQPSQDGFELSGQIQFLDLTPAQTLAWYLRLYGTFADFQTNTGHPLPSWVDPTNAWQSAVNAGADGQGAPNGAIPGAVALRGHVDSTRDPAVYVEGLYESGLVAFDDWSQQNYGQSFADATPEQQDALLAIASNPAVSGVSGGLASGGFPGIPSPLPNPLPPPAASNLFPVIVLHTIQGTYGLPEYAANRYAGQGDLAVNGRNDATTKEPKPGTIWASIGWDGDTVPLGNSIYEYGDRNDGFDSWVDARGNVEFLGWVDAQGHEQPQGRYEQYRNVSTPDDDIGLTVANGDEVEQIFEALQSRGFLKIVQKGAAR